MAAITERDSFTGSSNPLTTGDGWLDILGNSGSMYEDGTDALPKIRGADSAIAWNTNLTEVYNSSNATGTNTRLTLSGGDGSGLFTIGEKISIVFGYIDDNNFYEAVLEIGGIAHGGGVWRDQLTLYKTVAGAVFQLGSMTPLKRHQRAIGDCRNYYFKSGSSLSVTHFDGEIFIKGSVFDIHERHDQDDFLLLHEADAGVPLVAKTGFKIYAGSTAIKVASFQSGTIEGKFLSPTGNDSNNGTKAAPYFTWNKWAANVNVNMIGLVEAGTISGPIDNLAEPSVTIGGTSYQDAPFFSARAAAGTFQVANTGTGCLYLKAGGHKYLCFNGWSMSGNNNVFNVIKLWSQNLQGVGTHPQFCRFTNMSMKEAVGGAIISLDTCWGQQVFPLDTQQAVDLEQSHHFTDCEISLGFSGGTAPIGTHGIYSSSGWDTLVEYCHLHTLEGDGGKNSWGTTSHFPLTVNPSDGCTVRYNHIHDCGLYGWYQRGGDDMEMAYNWVENCGYGYRSTTASGLMVFSWSGLQYVHHNVVVRCGANGINTTAGISVSNDFQQTADGLVYIYGNTVYYSSWHGILISTAHSAGTTRNVSIFDNVSYFSFGFDVFIDANSVHASNTTSNNHVTVDGDPQFVDLTLNAEDFNLQSTSPLRAAGVLNGSVPTIQYKYDYQGKLYFQNGFYPIGSHAYPVPAENPPIIVLPSSYMKTEGQNLLITGFSVSDTDGDTLTIDGLTDSETTGFTCLTSGTGTFLGSAAT